MSSLPGVPLVPLNAPPAADGGEGLTLTVVSPTRTLTPLVGHGSGRVQLAPLTPNDQVRSQSMTQNEWTKPNNGYESSASAPAPAYSSPAPAGPPPQTMAPTVLDPSIQIALGKAQQYHPASSGEFTHLSTRVRQQLQEDVMSKQNQLMSMHPSHQQLVEALLNKQANEFVITSLPTESLTMRPALETTGRFPTINRTGGSIILTNKRLLLLSNSMSNVSAMSWQHSPITLQLQGHYLLSHELRDSVWFFPIDLQLFKHFSLEASARIQCSERIMPVKGCCWRCFGCQCCSCCVEEWEQQLPGETQLNSSRTLQLSVLLPPWNIEHEITVIVDRNISMGQFQQYALEHQKAVEQAKEVAAPK